MPKFGAHMLFVELARSKRPDLFSDLDENALRLGAIGPDMTLFLLDPVTNEYVRKGLDLAFEILTVLHDISEKLKEITKIFDGPPADLANWVSGGMSQDVDALLTTSFDTLISVVKLGLADGAGRINLQNPFLQFIKEDGIDVLGFVRKVTEEGPTIVVEATDNYGFPFRYFGHPYTDDGKWKQPEPVGDYSKWWWMDMLHYRKTGQFAKALLANAASPIEEAYAKGYMSHIAGDLCGHPYVNSIVGGPFRNHAYRHMVLESLADTWLWKQQGRGDVLEAALDERAKLSRDDLVAVANLIERSMREVYQPPEVPQQLPQGYPTNDELVASFERMFTYLHLSTDSGVRRPEAPPDSLSELVDEMQKLLSRNQPGQFPGGGGTFLEDLLAVLAWCLKGMVLLLMLVTLPLAVLMRAVAIGPRWILYFLHLGIFMVHSGIRTLLALMGWGYAGAEDFDNFGFLEEWIHASPADVEEYGYPRQTASLPKPPYYWLIPPRHISKVEDPRTFVAAHHDRQGPAWLVDPANVMEQDRALIDAMLNATTPEETIAAEIAMRQAGGAGFGNAVDFTIALLDGSVPVPDMDLDGDRGFGFRTWEGLPPADARYV